MYLCSRFFASLSSAVVFAVCASASVVTVSYPNFSSTAGLQLNGNAATAGSGANTVLRLTPALGGQAGSVFSTNSVAFATSADTFSTFFQFQLTNPGGIDAADGFAFVLQPNSNSVGGAGGGIGFLGIPNSVGVEFDTFNNGEVNADNHVGVDVNGALNDFASTAPFGVTDCHLGSVVGKAGCMANGDVWSVWIDYDGTNIKVAVNDNSNVRPANLFSYPIDVAGTLGTNTAFVGFTSATGAGFENHDILNWTYTNTLAPIGGSATPEPGSLALLMGGLGVLGICRKKLFRLL